MRRRHAETLLLVLLFGTLTADGSGGPGPTLVDVARFDARIATSVRYATVDNFTGAPVPGYGAPKALLTRPAAEALKKAQDGAERRGYRLLVYDAYRPARAVRAFVNWAAVPVDAKAEKERLRYFPTVEKKQILTLGYVADRSRHSAGSTVDLTLLPAGAPVRPLAPTARTLTDGRPILFLDDGSVDMGTSWDFFGPASRWDSPLVSPEARARRKLLREVMETAGFEPFDEEWWHFSLKGEPYRNKVFDLPLEN